MDMVTTTMTAREPTSTGKMSQLEVQAPPSPWTQPHQWLLDYRDTASSIMSTLKPSYVQTYLSQTSIYLQLLCLLLNRIRASEVNTQYSEILRELEAKLMEWQLHYQFNSLTLALTVKNYLDSLLTKINTSHQDHNYVQAVSSDTIGLWAHTLSVLENRQNRDEITHASGENAQALLNTFQYLLSHTHLGGQTRNRVLRALIKLSHASGRYPDGIPFIPFSIADFPMQPEGQGSFSFVYKLKLDVNGVTGREVAAKMIMFKQESEDLRQKFRKRITEESLIWPQLFHPNLLPFLGIIETAKHLCLVSPWMSNGSVQKYLGKNQGVDRLAIAHDITQGLEYLHSIRIIHGDLKPANIFVDNDGHAQLADFGLSYAFRDSYITFSVTKDESDHISGTDRFMAPEVIHGASITYKSDIFSLASTLYQIFTGYVPHYRTRFALGLLRKLSSGIPPDKPDEQVMKLTRLDQDLWDKMMECWRLDAKDRPTASELQVFMSRKAVRPSMANNEDEDLDP